MAAEGFIAFKPSVLERKVNNNDNLSFFSVLMFAKPDCDNVMHVMAKVMILASLYSRAGPEVKKTMLNSTEHGILNTHNK